MYNKYRSHVVQSRSTRQRVCFCVLWCHLLFLFTLHSLVLPILRLSFEQTMFFNCVTKQALCKVVWQQTWTELKTTKITQAFKTRTPTIHRQIKYVMHPPEWKEKDETPNENWSDLVNNLQYPWSTAGSVSDRRCMFTEQCNQVSGFS